ncbi:hypothetical protein [Stenomitos frigidus]|nr:hypothetical protein [Stenomitos frigidus]
MSFRLSRWQEELLSQPRSTVTLSSGSKGDGLKDEETIKALGAF